MKRLFAYRRITDSVAALPRSYLITSREVNEARRPHTCYSPCPFEEKNRLKEKVNHEKNRRTQNTQRNPQQPCDCDQLGTACDETRPTRWPILPRFHRSRVCGNRPRTVLTISRSDECYRYTNRHTDKQTN